MQKILRLLCQSLLKYSNNYSMKSGRLLNYYRDKVNNNAIGNAADYRVNNNKTIKSKSFEYKAKIIGSTAADNDTLDT